MIKYTELTKMDLAGFIIKSRIASDSKYGPRGDRKTLDVEINIVAEVSIFNVYKNGKLNMTLHDLDSAIDHYNSI